VREDSENEAESRRTAGASWWPSSAMTCAPHSPASAP
jgi:hypothetical protein